MDNSGEQNNKVHSFFALSLSLSQQTTKAQRNDKRAHM